MMTVSFITIACLLSPVSTEILVPRMQIRAERTGWKAVRLRAEPPTHFITKHSLWTAGRIGRITDIKVAAARDCSLSNSWRENETLTPLLSSVSETSMEILCTDQTTINLRGTLYQDRDMYVARRAPFPCFRSSVNNTVKDLLSDCLSGYTMTNLRSDENAAGDPDKLWCFTANITTTTLNRAVKDNAYFRPFCTELEIEWVWWDGNKTWSLLSDSFDVARHLSSQSLELQSEMSKCLTDHCVAVGRTIFSKFESRSTRYKRQIDHNERQRWESDRAYYCPYENKNRQVLAIGDKRYDGGFTCEDYMDEWVVTWNSYAQFAKDVISFQNRSAHDVLELYKLTNTTASVMEILSSRLVKLAQEAHAAEINRARELSALKLEVRLGFSIAEQRSTLTNALVSTLHTSQIEANAWRRYAQWHSAAGQCVYDKCEHLNRLITADGGIITAAEDGQPPPIIEQWQPTVVSVIAFEAQFNQASEVLTLCSIPYSVRRGCEQGKCKECLEQEAWCAKGKIERNMVVIAELKVTTCNGRQDTSPWVLIPTAEDALLADGRYAGCLNITFNGVFPLPWSTCFGTTQVARWIDPLPTRYIPQEQRSIVLVSAVQTWSLPSWANGTDEVSRTLREVQQRAQSRAEAVSDWINEQVSARQTLDYESQKGILHSMNTVSQGAHPLSVVALGCALFALLLATLALLTVTPVLRLLWVAILALVKHTPLYCAFTYLAPRETERVPVISALKGGHKAIEFRACLAQSETLEALDLHVKIVLHTSGKASLEYGSQRITEFVYGSHRRHLLLTDILMGSTLSCKCSLNDDIEITANNWPTLSTSEGDTSSPNTLPI